MYFIWIKWWQGLSASPDLPSWICFALGFSSCCLNVRVLLSVESGIFAFWGHFLFWFRLHICYRQGNSRFIYSESLVLFSHRLTVFDQCNNRLCANKQDNTPKIYCSFTRHINGEFPASQTEMSDGPKQSFWIQMSCLSFNCRQVRCEFWSRSPPVSPKKQTELTDLSLCLSYPPDALITTEWRQDFNFPCRCFGIFVKPFLQWKDLFLMADLPLSPVWPSFLHSEGRGRLDFGGQDLPEPPLQLLHVGRFGSCQVEAASSFLTVYSSQCSEHLKHRQRCNALK